MDANVNTMATIPGAIQKYLDRKWMDLDQTEFDTPLANSSLLATATLKENSGSMMEFRRFDHFPLVNETADDSPKEFTDVQEPSTALKLDGDTFQAAPSMIKGFVSVNPPAVAVDVVDISAKIYDEFRLWTRRMTHRLVNGRLVKAFPNPVLNASNTLTTAPTPFKAIFARGVASYQQMKRDNFISMTDIMRAVAILRNSKCPTFSGGKYAVIADPAILQQLAFDDPKFKDMLKLAEDKVQRAYGKGSLISWAGADFVVQDDPYCCHLPNVSGAALTTRKDAGKLHAVHILGFNAAGYLDFGKAGSVQRRTLAPKFKVQDITVTGTEMTIGVSMSVQALVLDTTRGLNLFGTSAFDEDTDDLPAVV